ncbi:hypothetical protein [Kineococcus sp. SYSU DK001]|uniref:hypothetical protein n=1 Tax=Kineococcus sp. SYSU DK001 TaxID=3383122 RepID=UPI003D7D3BBE
MPDPTPPSFDPDVPPDVREFVDGVHLEALDGLHAAYAGDYQQLGRIVARAADPGLLAYVLACQGAYALSRTRRPAAVLAEMSDRIDPPGGTS